MATAKGAKAASSEPLVAPTSVPSEATTRSPNGAKLTSTRVAPPVTAALSGGVKGTSAPVSEAEPSEMSPPPEASPEPVVSATAEPSPRPLSAGPFAAFSSSLQAASIRSSGASFRTIIFDLPSESALDLPRGAPTCHGYQRRPTSR